MAELWRGRVPRRRAIVAAALLLIIFTVGGSALLFLPRSSPSASGPAASASPGEMAALTAIPSETLTASPSPTASPTASPSPSPSPTPGPSVAPKATLRITAKPAPTASVLPNLRWVSAALTTHGCGQPLTAYIVIENSGYADAPAGVVVSFQLKVNGAVTSTVTGLTGAALAPGASVKVEVTLIQANPCATGHLSATIVIDPGNKVKEYDEGDNTALVG
jgi:hypothetical protein